MIPHRTTISKIRRVKRRKDFISMPLDSERLIVLGSSLKIIEGTMAVTRIIGGIMIFPL